MNSAGERWNTNRFDGDSVYLIAMRMDNGPGIILLTHKGGGQFFSDIFGQCISTKWHCFVQ